ncbi:MAG: metallophosphoesterase family protein [Myxococcota bacterium]|nr:metallophosphoesterase family protein [Myxococcota bacterium]
MRLCTPSSATTTAASAAASRARRRGSASSLADPPLEFHWARRRLLVVHDPRDLARHAAAAHDLALHGHTHRYHLARSEGRVVFNPGECAGHLSGHNAVGIVDLVTMETELLWF